MYGILGDSFAIIVETMDHLKLLEIRDELKEIDLFERFSFDVTRGSYVFYLKTITTDNYEKLYSLISTKGYRLVKCHY